MSGPGFPDGARWTPVPDLFFSRYLAEASDPVAIKVALHAMWRIYRRPTGAPPALRHADMVADPTLRRGVAALGADESEIGDAVSVALDTLVAGSVLLEVWVAGDERPERWLLINGREGRAVLARWHSGGLVLPDLAPAASGEATTRPTVFALYEQNIGALTPMLAEELRDAEATYPPDWIEDALRLAVENNARKWAYVRAILERWAREGRDDEADQRGAQGDRERDIEGPYAAYVEH